MKTCGEKILQLKPNDNAFKMRVHGAPKMSAADEKAVNEDISSFLDDMSALDKQLRAANPDVNEDQENKSIFSNEDKKGSKPLPYTFNKPTPLAEKIEKQKLAENERLKGNEFMKAKDYQAAITAYSRSLELNPTEAATFSNRAMAYLKQASYRQCIEDAEKAIELKPGYLKAHHRRGKAYAALNKHEDAIRDFQLILESEPENADVNKDLKDARRKLKMEQEKEQENNTVTIEEVEDGEEDVPINKKKEEKKKGKFTRVAIEESSSEEEEG